MVLQHIGPMLLKEVEVLAKDKFLNISDVLYILEDALTRVFSKTYGSHNDIRVSLDPGTGAMSIQRYRFITDQATCPFKEIERSSCLKGGYEKEGFWIEDLPMLPLSRTDVHTIKSCLTKDIQDLERQAQFNEFKNKVGQVLSVSVRRVEGRNLIVDVGHAEGVILSSELVPREHYGVNDRLKAYLYAVKQETRGPQIFLSRTHPGFLKQLLSQEVPEISDGLIEVKEVVRDPGSRAKVAIFASHMEVKGRSFDPVGTCVGVRGNRVNAISKELQNERIDIVLWDPQIPVFVVNALSSVEVQKVIIESMRKVTVVVPDAQKSLAIGRGGQNVRLACKLTGMDINIMTVSAEHERRTRDRQERARLFIEKLDLDELMAHFLVAEGFETVEDIAQVSVEDLERLEGFTTDVAQQLHERARESLEEVSQEEQEAFKAQGGDQQVLDMGFPSKGLYLLVKNGILTVDRLAQLGVDELESIMSPLSYEASEEFWGHFIMLARACESVSSVDEKLV